MKRFRVPNASSGDREILLQLVDKFKEIIENKKTDGISNNQKERAWQQLTIEFNALVSQKRETKQLKSVSLCFLQ
jgi:Skp family chaperone for outer membrane proteins